MKTNFFNALKEGNLQLTRAQLKEINGGDILYAAATARCSGEKTVTCTGDNCVSQDGVGCSCTSAGGKIDEKSCPKPNA